MRLSWGRRCSFAHDTDDKTCFLHIQIKICEYKKVRIGKTDAHFIKEAIQMSLIILADQKGGVGKALRDEPFAPKCHSFMIRVRYASFCLCTSSHVKIPR